MSLSAEEDDIPWDSLRDNRDLTVFTSWDPKERSSFVCSQFGPSLSFAASLYLSFFYFPRRLADEHRRLSLEEETVWLRIRSLTLRLVTSMAALGHTCAQNAETANENGIGDKASILSSLLSQLNQTLQTAAQLLEKRVQVCRRGGGAVEAVWGRRAQNVCFVAVSIPGTALHALGLRSVHRELSLPSCSPPAVCPPTGAGAAGPRSEPPPATCSSSGAGCLGMLWLIWSFPPFADESSELQTQICNGFKSLVVQLQGEPPRSTESKLFFFFLFFVLRCVSCCLVLSAEILKKCRGDLLGMKDGKLKTQPSLLENLIFFVEVRRSCFQTQP